MGMIVFSIKPQICDGYIISDFTSIRMWAMHAALWMIFCGLVFDKLSLFLLFIIFKAESNWFYFIQTICV